MPDSTDIRPGTARRALALLPALLLGVVLWTLTETPYRVADAAAQAAQEPFLFNGYLTYPEDMDTYRTFAGQAARGHWLFANPAWLEGQPSYSYFNLTWLAVGKLQAWAGLTFPEAFGLLRLLATLLLTIALYQFLGLWILGAATRLAALLLAASTSGLGWLFLIQDQAPPAMSDYPVMAQGLFSVYQAVGGVLKPLFMTGVAASNPAPDLYTETTALYQILYLPHVACAVALLLWAVLSAWKQTLRTAPGRSAWVPGLLLVVLACIRPYDALAGTGLVALLYLFDALRTVFRRRAANKSPAAGRIDATPGKRLLARLLWLIPSVVAMAGYWWLLYHTPSWKSWGEGNVYPTADWSLFFLAYFWGLGGLLALLVWRTAASLGGAGRRHDADAAATSGTNSVWLLPLMAAWHIALLASPLPFAWRTAAPLGVVLGVALAVFLYQMLVPWVARTIRFAAARITLRMALPLLLFLAATPSTVYVILNSFTISSEFNRYFFIEKEVNDALSWAGKNLPTNAVVLTHGHYAMKLPAYGDLRTVLWHKDMTPQFSIRRDEYHLFNRPDLDTSFRAGMLTSHAVEFIISGPLDRKYGQPDDLRRRLPNLVEVYSNPLVHIYKTTRAHPVEKPAKSPVEEPAAEPAETPTR